MGKSRTQSKYKEIYDIVRMVPRGKVITYGQVSQLVERCTPRMVGYAMAALNSDSDTPWQRVINWQGKVSYRSHGSGHICQRKILESEGVEFNSLGCANLDKYGWRG